MDEGWAKTALDLEEAGAGLPPTGEEIVRDPELSPLYYDPRVARLDLIADRVLAVRTATQAGYSKDHKEPSFEPLTRPTTALERERERRNLLILDETDRMFREVGLLVLGFED